MSLDACSPAPANDRSDFLGRTAALEALASGHRLITVTGPPGIGKTSVVRRFLEQARLGGQEGWFCDLSAAHDIDAMCSAVARGLRLGAEETAAGVSRGLAGCGRILLVLDNIEHLLPAAADLVVAWLATAEKARILVASRQMLRAGGEHVHELGPLPEAAELFLARAARSRHGSSSPEAGDRKAVDAIVARLDGVPLAIELAAAGEVPCTTMEKAVERSWALLDPHERRVLAAASVFPGGFTIEAAEAVLGAELDPDDPPIFDVLQVLREASLLRVEIEGSSRAVIRFGMYESIRAFAASQLAAGDGQRQIERRRDAWLLTPAGSRGTKLLAREGNVELCAARDGSWMRLDTVGQIDLSRHAARRRLVAALCDRREASPGEPIPVPAMIAIGWPGERLAHEAARNRLYVEIGALRAAGLRDVVLRRTNGYLLHPGVVLARPPEPRDRQGEVAA